MRKRSDQPTIRISLRSLARVLHNPRHCVSKGEEEGSALPDRRLGPNAAAVAHDDSLHNRETDAGAWELRITMQTLKRDEKLVGVLYIESRAVVPNAEGSLIFNGRRCKFDVGFRMLPCVLPGISQQ